MSKKFYISLLLLKLAKEEHSHIATSRKKLKKIYMSFASAYFFSFQFFSFSLGSMI